LILKPPFEIIALTSLLLYQLLVCILFKRVYFVSTSMGEIKGPHWQNSLCQCKASYSGMLPGFPEAPLRDTLPMCHSPLQHILRQATHNTLGLGSWSTVSYLFRDRPATRTGPRLSAIRRHPR
jgi:hypothetical protein